MENKVHFFRMTHFTKEGLTQLLLGLTFLFVLNSCSKEATLEEVSPASVETTSILKEWATKNDHLNQANLIEWDYSIPITLSDSIKGYAAPVKTESGFKEFISFELGGKRHGWFKTYKRLNETDMEIVIQSIEGKTLKSGVLHKSKNVLPKGKISTMREMNFEEGPITFNTIFDDFIFSAPRLYSPSDNYVYVGTYQYEFKAYYDSDSYIGGSGGAGSLNFNDYNYTEFEDKFTNSCFSKVLAELRSRNLYGEIGVIINKFIINPKLTLSFTQEITLYDELTKEPLLGSFDPKTNTIKLNESLLANTSQEFIASVLIHEILHANIGKTEDIDHVTMLEKYIIPAGEYLNRIYGIDKNSAENLLISGLKNASNYISVTGGFATRRYQDIEISLAIYKYNKYNIGHYCN